MNLNDHVRATWQWLHTCFGKEIATSREERGLRLLEEALELAQAAGVSEMKAVSLAAGVFHKPAGDVAQEVGDVANTLFALCGCFDIDLEVQCKATLARNHRIAGLIADKWLLKEVAYDLRELQYRRLQAAVDKEAAAQPVPVAGAPIAEAG